MSDEVKESLLEGIKQHLRVTWNYQDTEILELIEDGKSEIISICGPSEFSEAGLARRLLKAYCRYAWSGTESMFEENYKRQLLRLQHDNGLKRFKERKEE